MTHKESEEFGKHNDDVEIVVGKTGVRPCEREKREQKGKRCVGTRMLVTAALYRVGVRSKSVLVVFHSTAQY